jgi:hypothetical protein
MLSSLNHVCHIAVCGHRRLRTLVRYVTCDERRRNDRSVQLTPTYRQRTCAHAPICVGASINGEARCLANEACKVVSALINISTVPVLKFSKSPTSVCDNRGIWGDLQCQFQLPAACNSMAAAADPFSYTCMPIFTPFHMIECDDCPRCGLQCTEFLPGALGVCVCVCVFVCVW